jgi:hypothetical protein
MWAAHGDAWRGWAVTQEAQAVGHCTASRFRARQPEDAPASENVPRVGRFTETVQDLAGCLRSANGVDHTRILHGSGARKTPLMSGTFDIQKKSAACQSTLSGCQPSRRHDGHAGQDHAPGTGFAPDSRHGRKRARSSWPLSSSVKSDQPITRRLRTVRQREPAEPHGAWAAIFTGRREVDVWTRGDRPARPPARPSRGRRLSPAHFPVLKKGSASVHELHAGRRRARAPRPGLARPGPSVR